MSIQGLEHLLIYFSQLEPGSPEANLTAYLLNHLRELRGASVREIAAECGVSAATVSRFARRVGCGDFAAMKVELTAACLSRQQWPQTGVAPQTIARAKEADIAWMRRTDTAPVARIANALCEAKTVACLLRASPQILALERELLLAGKQIVFESKHPGGLAELAPGDVALLQIETQEQWQILRPALARRGRVVAAGFCALPLADAAKYLDHVLTYSGETDHGKLQREWLMHLLMQAFSGR